MAGIADLAFRPRSSALRVGSSRTSLAKAVLHMSDRRIPPIRSPLFGRLTQRTGHQEEGQEEGQEEDEVGSLCHLSTQALLPPF